MRHFDQVLKVYAEQGLRSEEEWKSLGREVLAGTAPRADAACRGGTVGLYTRDQTHPRPASGRRGN